VRISPEEIIIFNECFNGNGRMTYLYRSRETGLWTACGCSAYKTAEMARKNGLRTVEGFSKRIQIPVTVLDMGTFGYIAVFQRGREPGLRASAAA
jgi:hypothetical protein